MPKSDEKYDVWRENQSKCNLPSRREFDEFFYRKL